MPILTDPEIKKLDEACKNLLEEEKIQHVGVINPLGRLIVGHFKSGLDSLLSNERLTMTYMQLQLDFNMRQDFNDVFGPIDYIASRRIKQLIVTVPIVRDLVLIIAEPDADDKKIIKRAEELFDDITISTGKN